MGFFEDNLDSMSRETKRLMKRHEISWEEARRLQTSPGFYSDSMTSDQNDDINALLEIRQLEINRLRDIISRCAAAIPNGAFCHPAASMHLMAKIPDEVSLYIKSVPTPKEVILSLKLEDLVSPVINKVLENLSEKYLGHTKEQLSPVNGGDERNLHDQGDTDG